MKICCVCKELKSLTEFNKNKSKSDGHADRCRKCYQLYQKEWYSKNRNKRKAQLKSYDTKRIDNNKLQVLTYLESNPCMDCGITDVRVLEFDHRDRNIKIDSVCKMIFNFGWDKVLEEIKKCDIRCANCHRIKTVQEMNWFKAI